MNAGSATRVNVGGTGAFSIKSLMPGKVGMYQAGLVEGDAARLRADQLVNW
jgi:hypothetical protein